MVDASDIETAVLSGHFRRDSDSERIHQAAESVVYGNETGTVIIRLKPTAVSSPSESQ